MYTPPPSAQIATGLAAQVDRDTFLRILKKQEHPLVLRRPTTMKGFKYLTRYDGYYFLVKSKEPLDFSREAEVIETEKIYILNPGMGV